MGKVDFRRVKTKNLRNPRDRAPLTVEGFLECSSCQTVNLPL